MGVVVAPVVLAIVQIVKRFIPKEYSPFVAVIAGVVVVGALSGFSVESMSTGFIVGLSASGLWEGGKKLGGLLKK